MTTYPGAKTIKNPGSLAASIAQHWSRVTLLLPMPLNNAAVDSVVLGTADEA